MCFLSPARFRPPFIFFALLFVVPLAAQHATAQSPPATPNAPHQRPAPVPADQEQILPYWTTETGWTTEIQLRNNRASADLTVTPVLRSADGEETALPPVTVKPQEVKIVDVGGAISGVAPQLVGGYGSVVLRYRASSARGLFAMAMIHGIGHPFGFHIDTSEQVPDYEAGSREGVWWLPQDTTTDYLILVNQGRELLDLVLSIYDANGKEFQQKVGLGPAATRRYSVRQLVAAGGLSGLYGGIRVSAAAHAGSLDTLHVLFDEKAGFSALLKMFDHNPQAQLQERDYARTKVWTLRAPMLALSSPDPALAFPPGTTLRPQLFIRNTTGKPLTASLRFNWRSDTTIGQAPGPALRLSPYETRRIDVGALQDGKTVPGDAHWASVTLTTNGNPDEIMAVAASYDDTLHYGAQTPFSDQLSFQWTGSLWEYDAYHNSLITAGNGGTKPTRAAFTIFYNQGTQKYELEQTLQPDEQMWIDVGKLIREHVPDKNGNVLPSELTSGSYDFRDLTNKGAGTLFEGKVIYDKTYGHAAYGCGGCCGYGGATVFFDPLALSLGFTAGDGVDGLNGCTDQYDDVSDSFYGTWSAANTTIATVDYYATHTGHGVGSTTSQADAFLVSALLRCPLQERKPGGGVNVVQVTLTNVDLTTDQVVVDLQGPSGATGTLMVTWNGPSGNASIANTSEGPGTYTFNPSLGNLVSGQYTGVTAQWMGVSNTYSKSFDMLGTYQHTQYNTPAESQCTGGTGGAYLTPGPLACQWSAVNLIQQFISQAWLNGSGITNNYGPCQDYLASCSPPQGGNQNYFREVSTIAPGCGSPNSFLSSTSVAVDVFSSGHPLRCGDQVLIVGLGGGTGTVKTVTDSCPACTGVAQIDDFNTSNACSLTGLGSFQTIRINR